MRQMISVALCAAALTVLASAPARADALAEANQQLAAHAYGPALQGYTRLAEAGNAEAQFHLGEMYWHGDGVTQDEGQAKARFESAAKGGSQPAAAFLQLIAQRQAHQADIVFYTSAYDGADLALEHYHCGTPAIPAVSKTSAEIKAVDGAVAAWQTCYNGFAAVLKAALPAGKMIPPAIADLMNDAEFTAATARMDRAYAGLASDAKRQADQVLARRAAWDGQTQAFAATYAEQKRAEYQRLIDAAKLDQRQAGANMGH